MNLLKLWSVKLKLYKFGKVLMVMALLFLVSACGTFKSFSNNDNGKVRINSSLVNSKCDEISYLYSGVQYDFCLLHASRRNTGGHIKFDSVWFVWPDFLFSAVADTLVLPYTAYKQVVDGNLKVVKDPQ